MALFSDPETVAPYTQLACKVHQVVKPKPLDQLGARDVDVDDLLSAIDRSPQAAAMRWLLVEQAAHIAADQHAKAEHAAAFDALVREGARHAIEIMARLRADGEPIPHMDPAERGAVPICSARL